MNEPRKLCLTVGLLTFEGSAVTQKMARREVIFALSNTTLLSTKSHSNWLMGVEDIASQSSVVL